MKKIITMISVLVLALACSAALAACGNKTYSVTFDTNKPAGVTANVENLPSKITEVKKDANITEPSTGPSLAGYDFEGWYKEAACTNVWNFASDKVTADTTLFAKWALKVSTLAAPTGLSVTSAEVSGDNVYTLNWTAVANASGYTVSVGTTAHQTTAATLNLTNLELDPGVYDIKVLAKGNGTNYADSVYSTTVKHWQATPNLSYSTGESTAVYTVAKGTADTTGTVVLPQSYKGKAVTAVNTNGFKDCLDITEVIIPEGIGLINQNAFDSCTNLETVNIPSTMKSIRDNAFKDTKFLTNAINAAANNSIVYVQNWAIASKGTLGTSVSVAAGTVGIGCNAFNGNTTVQEVILPSSVKAISASAFASCSALTTVILPAGLEFIGTLAFVHCTSLTELIIPHSVTTIQGYAFMGTSGLLLKIIGYSSAPDTWPSTWNDSIEPSNITWNYIPA